MTQISRILLSLLTLCSVLSAYAGSCEKIADQANLTIMKLNAEAGGKVFQKMKKSRKTDGGLLETYAYHDGIASGYAVVRVDIFHGPIDETNPECTVFNLSWGNK